jgi:hypothetical protein
MDRTIKFCHPQYRIDRPPPEMMDILRVELIKPENQVRVQINNSVVFV